MNKIVTYLFVILMGFTISCKDNFLERPPLGSLTAGTFPSTSDEAIAATNGIYNTLRVWQFNTGGFPLLDIMSDDALKGSNPGDGAQLISFDKFTFTASDINIENWYRTLYLGIQRAHLVFEKVPSITMDEALKSRLLAEAHFLRGYFYSILVRGFGDVPIITSSETTSGLARSPVELVYQEIIIPDLEFALENLPEKSDYSPDDAGRITKGAVRALLARLYLFRKDFINAQKYALEAINSQ